MVVAVDERRLPDSIEVLDQAFGVVDRGVALRTRAEPSPV